MKKVLCMFVITIVFGFCFTAIAKEQFEESQFQLDRKVTVTVNYDLSLKEMIKAGRYDVVQEKITDSNFPIKKRKNGEIELYIVHCRTEVTIDQIDTELNKQGFRPVELPELLAFGATYPNLYQKDYFWLALGSRWQKTDNGYLVPNLYGSNCGHELDLGWFTTDYQWTDGFRILITRK